MEGGCERRMDRSHGYDAIARPYIAARKPTDGGDCVAANTTRLGPRNTKQKIHRTLTQGGERAATILASQRKRFRREKTRRGETFRENQVSVGSGNRGWNKSFRRDASAGAGEVDRKGHADGIERGAVQ